MEAVIHIYHINPENEFIKLFNRIFFKNTKQNREKVLNNFYFDADYKDEFRFINGEIKSFKFKIRSYIDDPRDNINFVGFIDLVSRDEFSRNLIKKDINKNKVILKRLLEC